MVSRKVIDQVKRQEESSTSIGMILIVDDDPQIVELLRTYLLGEGWNVVSATNGEKALEMVDRYPPDLVILDIMLPGMEGMEVCRRIRSRYSMPIIMLSALSDPFEKVRCLDSGADDYVTKPFVQAELSARIRAAFRRKIMDEEVTFEAIVCNSLKVDLSARRVTLKGREVKLTPIEFRILEELVKQSGKVLGYRYLLNKIWGSEYQDEKEYLHVHIKHLRAKIEPDPENPVYVINVPGIGYRFEHHR